MQETGCYVQNDCGLLCPAKVLRILFSGDQNNLEMGDLCYQKDGFSTHLRWGFLWFLSAI